MYNIFSIRVLIFSILSIDLSLATYNENQSDLCRSINATSDVIFLKDEDVNVSNALHQTHYRRNSSTCALLPFDGKSNTAFPSNITLKTYLYIMKVYSQTAFNISFSNVSWNSLRLRYKQNGNEGRKNYCRDFTIDPIGKVSPDFVFFYDCIWSDQSYEGSTFQLELLAKNDVVSAYKRYMFKVPEHKHVQDYHNTTVVAVREINYKKTELFMYTDVSDTSNLILHFQPLPKASGIHNYRVNLTSDDTNISSMLDAQYKELVELAFKTSQSGKYIFSIEPIGDNCEDGCLVSQSPVIHVEETPGLKIAIGLYLFIAVIVIFLGFVFICVKRKIEEHLENFKSPTVYFLYKATHVDHVHVIDAIRSYFESQDITVLIDRHDIPKTDDENPSTWIDQSLDKASVILVFSALSCCEDEFVGPYKESYNIGRNRLTSKFNPLIKKFVYIQLPYCSSKIPKEFKHYHLYKIPEEMKKLVQIIKGSNCLDRLISTANKTSNTNLNMLKDIIEDAKSNLSKHSRIENSYKSSPCNLTKIGDEEENLKHCVDKLIDEEQLSLKISDNGSYYADDQDSPCGSTNALAFDIGKCNLLGPAYDSPVTKREPGESCTISNLVNL